MTAALDAAEHVAVDYEALPAVTERARRAGARTCRSLHEAAPGNVCFRWARGDEAAVAQRFADGAAQMVSIDLVNNQRIGGAAIEPRAAVRDRRAGTDKLTL